MKTYRIRYEYISPSSAGPYRGTMTVKDKHAKGDIVCAVFGRAEVTSCREVKPPQPEALGHQFSTVCQSL
jgi:hypothetical protein